RDLEPEGCRLRLEHARLPVEQRKPSVVALRTHLQLPPHRRQAAQVDLCRAVDPARDHGPGGVAAKRPALEPTKPPSEAQARHALKPSLLDLRLLRARGPATAARIRSRRATAR